jgi:hypothetical protein
MLHPVKQQGYLQTGQTSCHDVTGTQVSCAGSGQDAEFQNGVAWPTPRFQPKEEVVVDRLTGLTWTRDANLNIYPLTWQEALAYVSEMNRHEVLGYADWRLPNRRELRSLISHQTKKPALPEGLVLMETATPIRLKTSRYALARIHNHLSDRQDYLERSYQTLAAISADDLFRQRNSS